MFWKRLNDLTGLDRLRSEHEVARKFTISAFLEVLRACGAKKEIVSVSAILRLAECQNKKIFSPIKRKNFFDFKKLEERDEIKL